MKRMLFALLAVTALGASSGCCCLENWWCRPWGCGCWGANACGGCGGCGSSGCGCGDSCGGCDSCGGGCGCAQNGPRGGYGGATQGYAQNCNRRGCSRNGCCNNGYQYGADQYAEDVGPPGGQVTYPYYTTRGPRDFLARNPNSIGP
ncbi:MAG TPA: hypothetical protein VMF30_18655 [Pirellulales bacterium]|nr:hypothetical protein [Pirellulales bacterium]